MNGLNGVDKKYIHTTIMMDVCTNEIKLHIHSWFLRKNYSSKKEKVSLTWQKDLSESKSKTDF